MNTPPEITLDHPDEWDFRSIHTEQHQIAAIYEYARQHPGVKQAVLDWLDGEYVTERLTEDGGLIIERHGRTRSRRSVFGA